MIFIIKFYFIYPLIAGLLLAISLPGYYIPFAFTVGFFIWFLNIYQAKMYKHVFLNSLATGFFFSVFSYYWIINALNFYGGVNFFVSIGLLILFSIFYSIFFFVTVGILAKIFFRRYASKGVLLVPFIWVIVEIVREYFPFSGFPWNLSGYMVSYITPFDKMAYYIGVYGLSFSVLLLSSVLFLSYVRKSTLLLSAGIFFPIFIYFLLGQCRLYNKTKGKPYKVAILQGNISEDIKQNKDFNEYMTEVYIKLFKKAAMYKPDFIIMPESALGFLFFSESKTKEKFFSSIKDIKIPFIVGLDNILYKDGKYYLYNSIFLFDENHKLIDFYNKIKLVPFGEYVPFPFKMFSRLFPYLEGWDFSAGSKQKVLKYKNVKFVPLICFEAIFPNFVADFAEKGNVLVNTSNDAWFGKSIAPFQHFEMSRLRAVETGKYLLRATNTGISAIVNPDGTIQKMSSLFKREIITGTFVPVDKKTFWLKYRYIELGVLLLVFFFTFLKYELGRR